MQLTRGDWRKKTHLFLISELSFVWEAHSRFFFPAAFFSSPHEEMTTRKHQVSWVTSRFSWRFTAGINFLFFALSFASSICFRVQFFLLCSAFKKLMQSWVTSSSAMPQLHKVCHRSHFLMTPSWSDEDFELRLEAVLVLPSFDHRVHVKKTSHRWSTKVALSSGNQSFSSN